MCNCHLCCLCNGEHGILHSSLLEMLRNTAFTMCPYEYCSFNRYILPDKGWIQSCFEFSEQEEKIGRDYLVLWGLENTLWYVNLATFKKCFSIFKPLRIVQKIEILIINLWCLQELKWNSHIIFRLTRNWNEYQMKIRGNQYNRCRNKSSIEIGKTEETVNNLSPYVDVWRIDHPKMNVSISFNIFFLLFSIFCFDFLLLEIYSIRKFRFEIGWKKLMDSLKLMKNFSSPFLFPNWESNLN